MGRVADWWMNRRLDGDWQMPISNVQGFRPVGGYLIGTSTSIEFVPNRFEALVGGSAWTTSVNEIDSVTVGRRGLRIAVTVAGPAGAAASQTLFTNRPATARRHLARFLRP
jgi:hypothetical protein